MSDALSFVELAGQDVELLPARTVLSLFSADGGSAGTPGAGGAGTPGDGHNESGSSAVNQVGIEGKGFHGSDGNANPGRP